MSSEQSQTQLSAKPKKTLPWCTNSTSGPYPHTHTQHGIRTQKQLTYKNNKSPKLESFESQPVAHRQVPCSTSIEKHWYSFSSNTCLWERHTFTHQQSVQPTSYITCEVLLHTYREHAYQTELDSLPLIPEKKYHFDRRNNRHRSVWYLMFWAEV